MPRFVASRTAPATPLPRLESALRRATLLGLALVLLLPAARGHSEWLGWLPLWLLGMPACAWWALHRFRLPLARVKPAIPRRRRAGGQARRRKCLNRQGMVRAA